MTSSSSIRYVVSGLLQGHENNSLAFISERFECSALRKYQELLGFRWYRNMSPTLKLEVNDVCKPSMLHRSFLCFHIALLIMHLQVYDAERHTLYLNVTQVFHIFWSVFKPAESRYVDFP